MIKEVVSNKSVLLGSLLIASQVFINTQVFAAGPKEMFCGESVNNSELAFSENDELLLATENPFIEINYPATFKKLPVSKRKEADALYQQLKQEYKALDSKGFDVDELATTKTMALEDKLNSLVCGANTELVTVNLLEKLSADKRKRAEALWQDIQNDSGNIEKKMDELFSMLDTVKVY
jgi:hypothetical protein